MKSNRSLFERVKKRRGHWWEKCRFTRSVWEREKTADAVRIFYSTIGPSNISSSRSDERDERLIIKPIIARITRRKTIPAIMRKILFFCKNDGFVLFNEPRLEFDEGFWGAIGDWLGIKCEGFWLILFDGTFGTAPELELFLPSSNNLSKSCCWSVLCKFSTCLPW